MSTNIAVHPALAAAAAEQREEHFELEFARLARRRNALLASFPAMLAGLRELVEIDGNLRLARGKDDSAYVEAAARLELVVEQIELVRELLRG